MRRILNVVILGALCLASAAAAVTQTSVDGRFQYLDTDITEVRDIELFPDGRIAYGGGGEGNIRPTAGILWPDGRPVWVNNFSGDLLNVTRSVAVDAADGALFIGGTPGSAFYYAVQRIAFGTDLNWTFKANVNGAATKVLVLPDGDVLGAGALQVFGDTNGYGLVRLNLDGTRDAEFAYTNTLDLRIENAVVLADGSVVATWLRTNSDLVSSAAGRWLRTGERDQAFNAMWAGSFGTNSQVTAMEKAPGTNGFVAAIRTAPVGADGPGFSKLLVFDENGNALGFLPKDPDSYLEGTVHAIAFEAVSAETIASGGYDRILVGGEFSKAGETPAKNLASLTKEGEAAWAFETDAGPSGPVYAVEVQLDGKVLIGGAFTNVNGVEALGMTRIHGSSAEGATYLYWQDAEFRAFEKLGAKELNLMRGGNLAERLRVELTLPIAASPDVTIPAAVEFAPEQEVATVPVTIQNDFFAEGRERFEVGTVVTNEGILVTRGKTELVVLDDETAGTVTPHFQYAAANGAGGFAVQADGKIVVITGRTTLVRLHPDGSVDPTFITNGLPILEPIWNAQIVQIEIDPAGKIYVSGRFNTTSGGTFGINHIARLNPDGSLDRGFDPVLRVSTSSSDLVIMDVAPDGGIVFWTPTSMARAPGFSMGSQRLFKHDTRGLWVASYGGGFTYSVANNGALEHLPNGDLLAYTASMQTLRKVRANGTMDTLAVTVPTSSGTIYDMEVHGDHVLLGGSFRQIDAQSVSNLTRLNPTTGSLDPNFNPVVNGTVYAVKVHGGKIYLSGQFTEVNGQPRMRLARLNGDGSLDASFDGGRGPNRAAANLEIQIDGSVILGGGFDRVDGIRITGLAQLEGERNGGEIRLVSRRIEVSETNGWAVIEVDRVGGSSGQIQANLYTVEGSARAGQQFAGTNMTVIYGDGEIGRKTLRIPVYADGEETGPRTFSVVVQGWNVLDEATVLLKDANAPLVRGTAFITGGIDEVRDVAIGADGFVYVAGNFNVVGGEAVTNLARLHPNLTLDPSYALEAIPQGPIDSVTVRTNGKVAFSGKFVEIDGNDWKYLAQVERDGTYDEEFINNHMAQPVVLTPARELLLQADDKLIAYVTAAYRRLNADGTADIQYGNLQLGSVVKTRLHPDGSLYSAVATVSGGTVVWTDPHNKQQRTLVMATHRTASGLIQPARIETLAIEPDGSLLIGGEFTHIGRTSASQILSPRLARVSTNGVVDTNFVAAVGQTGLSPRDKVTAIEVLADGSILIGGKFSLVQGANRSTLALLEPDGTLRADFNPQVEGSGIAEFERAPDGGVVVRGSVTAVDGNAVGDLFKLGFRLPLAPVVEFLWPTNGSMVGVSDVEDEIRVHAFDPDGAIERAVLELDGVSVGTNSSGNIPFRLFLPASGEHTLRLTVTDESGLTTSKTITFQTVGQELAVKREGDEVVIQYSGGGLQESTDLADWRNVHSGGGEYRTSATGERRFFRSVK